MPDQGGTGAPRGPRGNRAGDAREEATIPELFRILNVTWATLLASAMVILCWLALPVPPPSLVAGAAFWVVYLGLAIGTFFDSRVAWLLSIVQLLLIWILMGVAVSDRSFVFITGQQVLSPTTPRISAVVFNGFFGVLVPSTGLLIMLLFSRHHLATVLRRPRRPRRSRPRRRLAAAR